MPLDANTTVIENQPSNQAPAPAPVPAPAPGPSPASAPAPTEGEVDQNSGERLEESSDLDPPGGTTRKPIQPRINELVRQRHEAQREAAYWRGVAEAAKMGVTSPAPAAAPTPPAKPTPDQFTTYDEYVDALTDWKSDRAVEKALAKVNNKIEEKSALDSEKQVEATRTKNWLTRQEAIKTALPDYDVVMGAADNVPVAQHVVDLLLDSEHGPAIAYKMAKDPALAEKLNGMTEREAAKAIGRLEAAFESVSSPSPSPAPAPATPKPPTLSKAPVPPTPVPQGSATSKDPSKMSMPEYVAWRKSQGLGR